jgi:hypothetical protein
MRIDSTSHEHFAEQFPALRVVRLGEKGELNDTAFKYQRSRGYGRVARRSLRINPPINQYRWDVPLPRRRVLGF